MRAQESSARQLLEMSGTVGLEVPVRFAVMANKSESRCIAGALSRYVHSNGHTWITNCLMIRVIVYVYLRY